MKNILPNLIVVGVTKTGTTSLFTYLSSHPEVCGSTIKEVSYFLPLRWGKSIAPLADYSHYFDHCFASPYRLEASPAYFFGGQVIAKKIKEILGEVKVIIMFRDPVSRLYSFYNFHKQQLHLEHEISFKDYIAKCGSLSDEDLKKEENYIYFALAGGKYIDYLEPWIDCFGNDLQIYFFEDLKKDTKSFLMIICKWLGIDDEFYSAYNFVIENKTTSYRWKYLHKLALSFNRKNEILLRKYISVKRCMRNFYYKFNEGRKAEAMDFADREYLEAYYRPYNKKLRSVLIRHGCDQLPSWLMDS